MRDLILNEIKRLAKAAGGKAPGKRLFLQQTGIRESDWSGKFWARWGDALVEAGYRPNDWTGRLDQQMLLEKLSEACRHYRKFPTTAEIELYRRSNPDMPPSKTYRSHFKTKNDMLVSLREWLDENDIDVGFVVEVENDANSNPW